MSHWLHKVTGNAYYGRNADTNEITEEPTIRVGWEHNGVLQERIAVWRIWAGEPRNATWVDVDNLEHVDMQVFPNNAADPDPSKAAGLVNTLLVDTTYDQTVPDLDPEATKRMAASLEARDHSLPDKVNEYIETHYYGDGHDHGVEEGIDLEELPDFAEPVSDEDSRWAFETVRHQWALQLAETMSFNVGNAIMELYLGNTDLAIVALQREVSRRYPADDTSDNKESPW